MADEERVRYRDADGNLYMLTDEEAAERGDLERVTPAEESDDDKPRRRRSSKSRK
jgi:hypothetical protein